MMTDMRADKQAQRVLTNLRRLAPKGAKVEWLLYPYQNLRERGFHVRAGWDCGAPAVSFSECRNSDEIVVYPGTVDDFSLNNHIPSDAAYGRVVRFMHGHTGSAARWIKVYLRGALKGDR